MKGQLRNKKKFFVKGLPYWMSELTVGNVFELHVGLLSCDTHDNLLREFFLSSNSRDLFKSVTDYPLEAILDLTISDSKIIWDSFSEVNRYLLSSKKSKTTEKDRGNNDFVKNLFSIYCELVESGHQDVLNYGYSFLLMAINNKEKNRGMRIADLSEAVRIAQHGDNKQWKKYIRSLVR